MAITCQIDETQRLITSVGEGLVSSDDIHDHLMQVLGQDPVRPGYSLLCDFREGELTLSEHAVDNMRLLLGKHAEILKKGKWAIVVVEEFEFGIGRLFSTLAENAEIKIEIFREIDRAMQWLTLCKPEFET